MCKTCPTEVVKITSDGIVVRNLSNMYCNIEVNLANTRLCIDSKEIYGCFKPFESPYFNFSKVGGIEVNGLTESLNRTVISVFCPYTCGGTPLHTQILNIEVLYKNG